MTEACPFLKMIVDSGFLVDFLVQFLDVFRVFCSKKEWSCFWELKPEKEFEKVAVLKHCCHVLSSFFLYGSTKNVAGDNISWTFDIGIEYPSRLFKTIIPGFSKHFVITLFWCSKLSFEKANGFRGEPGWETWR